MNMIFNLLIVASLFSCGLIPAIATPSKPPIRVMVSILPLKGFVRQVGGSSVAVEVMVRPGHSPATYEPTPQQMAFLQKADIFFAAGVPFERAWLKKIERIMPELKVVYLGGSGGEMDPHWWVDPKQAAMAVDKISISLGEWRPEEVVSFKNNGELLRQELLALDNQLAEMFAASLNKTFLVYHPAWGHLAKSYGLKQVAIEKHGKEPGPRDLQQIIQWGKKQGVSVVFIQTQFPEKLAKEVAQSLGASIVRLDPLAENYQENLLQVGQTIKQAL